MNRFTLLLMVSLLAFLSSCVQDKCKQTMSYTALKPVYMSYEELRSSVASEAPRDLKNPGKMYVFGDYLFISEVNEGVHIINNSNPSNPVMESFIKVPGNHDIAVKGNVLYADSYIDLVAIDISNPLAARELSRQEDVFPHEISWPALNNAVEGVWYPMLQPDPELGVVMDWLQEPHTEEINCNQYGSYRGGVFMLGAEDFNASIGNLSSGGSPNSLPSGNLVEGLGGSLARFAIIADRMYAVTDWQMILFNLEDPARPFSFNTIELGFGVETIFPYEQNLFIGSQTGMFIYDASNPNDPNFLSEFVHMRNCDPVVVEGDFAYVTLRSGNGCPGTQNLLHVVDISNLSSPDLIASYQMTHPGGLGIKDDVLFICDGGDGLKIYDATDKMSISTNMIEHYRDIEALDVIPLNNILLMIGEDGFYQYNFEDLDNIYLMSTIPVNK